MGKQVEGLFHYFPVSLISKIGWTNIRKRGNSSAMLFPSMSDKNFGKKMMSSGAIHLTYRRYKLTYFPKLLNDQV